MRRGFQKNISIVLMAVCMLACRNSKSENPSTGDAQSVSRNSHSAIPAWKELPKSNPERAESYRKIVNHFLMNTKEPLSAAGACEAFTQVWLKKLNEAHGYKLFYAETSGSGSVNVRPDTKIKQDKTHVFVVDRSLCPNSGFCENEIIIDPTFIQFFEPGECLYENAGEVCKNATPLKQFPTVLVGTPAMIKSFYREHQEKVRLYSLSGLDSNMGKYEGESAAELIYSLTGLSTLRTFVPLFH